MRYTTVKAKKTGKRAGNSAGLYFRAVIMCLSLLGFSNRLLALEEGQDNRTSISFGDFRIKAEKLIRNTSFGNGGIRIKLQNCEITKKDGTVKILAKEAIVMLKFRSVIRMEIEPQIIKLKQASIEFYPKDDVASKEKSKENEDSIKEKIQTLGSILELVEGNLSIFKEDTLAQSEASFEDIRITINNSKKDQQSFYIDKVHIASAEQPKVIEKYISKNYSIGTFTAKIESKSDNYNIKAFCSVREFGKLCEIELSDIDGRLINRFLKHNNKQLLDFTNLMVKSKVEFGSHLGGNRIKFTGYTKEGSFINMWTGEKINVGPTVSSLELDTKEGKIQMRPTIISTDKFGTGEFGFEIKLRPEKGIDQKYSWNVGEVPAKSVEKILTFLGGISQSMANAMNGIKENVTIGGEAIKSCQGQITEKEDQQVVVDIAINTENSSCTIPKLNSLLISEIKSDIKISSSKVTIGVHSLKIGNDKMSKALVEVINMKSNKPILNVLVSGRVPLLSALENPSMPKYAQNIRDFMGIQDGANLSGQIKSSIILLKGELDMKDQFSYKSDMIIDNIKSHFFSGEKGLKISVQKGNGEQSLKVEAETSDGTKMQFGPDINVRNPEEKTLISFTVKDIFKSPTMPDNNTKLAIEKSPEGVVQFQDIKIQDSATKETLAEMSLDIDPDEIFIKSKFAISASKFKLLNSNISGTVSKKFGRDYGFDINGEQIDWREVFKVYLFLRGDAKERNFGMTNIRGYVGVDKFIMFNNVEAKSLHLKSIIKKGVFKDVQLSADLRKIPSALETIGHSISHSILRGIERNGIRETSEKIQKFFEEWARKQEKIEINASELGDRGVVGSIKSNLSDVGNNKPKKKVEQETPQEVREGESKQQTGICGLNDEEGKEYGIFLHIAKGPYKNTVNMQAENIKILFEGLDIAKDFFEKTSGFSVVVKGLQVGPDSSAQMSAGTKSSIRGTITLGSQFCYIAKASGGKERPIIIEEGTTNFDINPHLEVLLLRDLSIKTDLINIKALGYMDFYENGVYLSGKIYLPQREQGKKEVASTEIPILGQAIKLSIESKRATAVLSFVIDGQINKMSESVSVKPSRPLLLLGGMGGIGVFGIIIGILTILL